jgi:hypothetical protein
MDERSPDISPFEKFFTLPDDQLFARLGEAAPNLKDDSISLIKKALKREIKFLPLTATK